MQEKKEDYETKEKVKPVMKSIRNAMNITGVLIKWALIIYILFLLIFWFGDFLLPSIIEVFFN